MKTAVLVCALFASHTLAAICPANAGDCKSFLGEADCKTGYVPNLNPAGSGKACTWYTAFSPAKCIAGSTCTITTASPAPATPSPPTPRPTATPATPSPLGPTPSPLGPTPKPPSKKDNKDYIIIIVIVVVLVAIGLAVVGCVWHRRRRRYVAIN